MTSIYLLEGKVFYELSDHCQMSLSLTFLIWMKIKWDTHRYKSHDGKYSTMNEYHSYDDTSVSGDTFVTCQMIVLKDF